MTTTTGLDATATRTCPGCGIERTPITGAATPGGPVASLWECATHGRTPRADTAFGHPGWDPYAGDGRIIETGSVLRDRRSGKVGVVVDIYRVGDTPRYPFGFAAPADMVVSPNGCSGAGVVTNIYDAFEHVPHAEQSRLLRWLSQTLSPAEIEPRLEIDWISDHATTEDRDWPVDTDDAMACLMTEWDAEVAALAGSADDDIVARHHPADSDKILAGRAAEAVGRIVAATHTPDNETLAAAVGDALLHLTVLAVRHGFTLNQAKDDRWTQTR